MWRKAEWRRCPAATCARRRFGSETHSFGANQWRFTKAVRDNRSDVRHVNVAISCLKMIVTRERANDAQMDSSKYGMNMTSGGKSTRKSCEFACAMRWA
jgi:hypothetical protein